MLASALLFFIFGLTFLFLAFVLAMICADADENRLYDGAADVFNALVPIPIFILAFVLFGCAIYCLFA
ncbi:hypothetical protein MAH1_33660 [Sessilibacter sp. MAH1]